MLRVEMKIKRYISHCRYNGLSKSRRDTVNWFSLHSVMPVMDMFLFIFSTFSFH